MSDKLQIDKRSNVKGDDGHKVISVRMTDELVSRLDEISAKTNRSRNQIINMMLEYGIENCEVVENKK